ncbi:MAG TPA: cytochrome b N-terminal domain-containing protein [Verrucomicrobiales bacterium]|nr:cytochrome b N-terminal domain-containing protein [Verrucomicrobiales bacterium]
MKALFNWLDHRTGSRRILHGALFENVPGGSRWRYVWGSTLTFAILVQFITGLILWMLYSPSSQTAWESVYYIQEEVSGGWMLRGIHHYTAQVMTVLLVLHLMQVVIDGAYKSPRELNFWFGLGLLFLVMGISLTGYLLPWDQKGYWATKVATNLAGITPWIGPDLQRLIVGGADYGHHTITRFFALHAGILPAILVLFIVAHIYLFRRHGLTPAKPLRRRDAPFWPDQVLKDSVACLAVLATVLLLVLVTGGAELMAPADPSDQYDAARPDWYFMFLFRVLEFKAFSGERLVWGAIYIPAILAGILFLLPFLGSLRIGRFRLGHWISAAYLWLLLFAFVVLTTMAVVEDRRSEDYLHAVKRAHWEAGRVKTLAAAPTGIPAAGAVTLLRDDPLTQGPKIFAAQCASCHAYDGHDGLDRPRRESPSAPDLAGFASREWLAGFLDPEKLVSPLYWGGTHFVNPPEGQRLSKMVGFVTEDLAEIDDAGRADLEKVIAAVSAQAQLKSQRDIDARDAEVIESGIDLFFEGIGDAGACIDCHNFLDEQTGSAVDLTGWGSRQWLIDFVSDPEHKRFYGNRNDRMPRFGASQVLNPKDIELVVDWLRGEWYEPSDAAESANIPPDSPAPEPTEPGPTEPGPTEPEAAEPEPADL